MAGKRSAGWVPSKPVPKEPDDQGRNALSTAGGPTPVLEVDDLHSEFHLRTVNVRAVDGVSFSVGSGECLGLVGESGCGKTTIGLSVMKLLPNVGHVTGGAVRLNGRDLVPLTEPEMRKVRGNDIGMIFQDPMTSLNPTWTIGRQIAEPVRIHKGANKSEALERAVEVLRLVGMPRPEERLTQYPHQLSGGLRQRVMIAMALSCEPKLLIADEPTTALDVTIQAQILDLIDELRQRLDMAVLLITHDMGVIASRTDRVMVMYAGKIIEGASTTALFDTMRHPYSEALFESIPRLNQDRRERLYSIPGLPPDLGRDLVGCRFRPRCRYATDVCAQHEPLLSSGTGPSPNADTASNAGLLAPAVHMPAEPGEHLYACFHPVTATSSERLSFQRSGDQSTVAAQPPVYAASSAEGAPVAGESEMSPGAAAPAGLNEPAGPYVRAAGSEAGAGTTASSSGAAATVAAGAEAPEREVVLRLDHVEKLYDVTAGAVLQRSIGTVKAVSGVTFSVRRGETFGLVGESGCGKTTIGRLVVALERPTHGAVNFEGEEVSALKGARLRQRRRDLQLMFQDPYASLDPRMRVRSIIREPLRIQGIGTAHEQDERVSEVLNEVGLQPRAADLYPHEFSGGQRQRIGLARALVLQPKLIVADEPVSALDVSIRAQILNLMRSLQEHHDLTYIVISHDLAVVKYLADTIGVMYLGKLVEFAPADELYEHAAHPYTRGLIDTIPVPDPSAAKRRSAAVQGELPSAISPPSGCRFRTRCPFAQERCAEEEPLLRPFAKGHEAACHFPLQTPLSEDLSSVSAASA
jgi:peptide/nickel transport system ATP-binding protein